MTLLGDTLVLRNGKEVTGEIERIDGGYRVKTATGYVTVTRSDVAEWRRAAPSATTPPATPAPTTPAPTTPAPTTPAPTPGKPASPVSPAAPSATRPPNAPMTEADKARRTVEVLVLQGTDALALGDFKAARDCFVDAIQIDPRNKDALASVGYCYVKLDDIPRATRSLEAALVGNPSPDRTLAMNLAYSLFRGRNTMRGAKVIKDYLAANSGAVDEEALNAFAICLGQSSDEARLSRFWTECVAFYDKYNATVEATRPGFKRWGVEWIPQSDWAVTDSKNKAVQSRMDAKWRDLTAARTEFSKLKKQYEDAYAASRFRKTAGATASSIEPRLIAARDRADTLQKEYNDLSATLIRPTLPTMFEPVPLEMASAGALASASDVGSSAGVVPDPPSLSEPPTLVRPHSAPQPGTPQPGTIQPGTIQPGTIQPGTIQPGTVQPPVAVTPPPAAPATPAPSTPPPAARKRAVFTYACGFGVGPDMVVTSAASVADVTRVSIQPTDSDPIDAEVVKIDQASGLALLRIKGQRISFLPVGDSFNGGVLQCVSYPTPSIFDPEAEVITGSSVPPKDEWAIRLTKHPRLAGAPVLADGRVVGVELASRDHDMTTIPTATIEQIKALVGVLPQAGVNPDPRRAVVMVSGVREQ